MHIFGTFNVGMQIESLTDTVECFFDVKSYYQLLLYIFNHIFILMLDAIETFQPHKAFYTTSYIDSFE